MAQKATNDKETTTNIHFLKRGIRNGGNIRFKGTHLQMTNGQIYLRSQHDRIHVTQDFLGRSMLYRESIQCPFSNMLMNIQGSIVNQHAIDSSIQKMNKIKNMRIMIAKNRLKHERNVQWRHISFEEYELFGQKSLDFLD
ncbi:hypothetical protein TNCT_327001 [Trichonephila clavata]|uniref:Uncharacterized protein n=1 Tax=Trichonephila clavata TaxID=2740835 RepID=A0A8X6L5E9_TRICU|nr:hypothetical protein TNCT_327001 [Trichonephila clavata]